MATANTYSDSDQENFFRMSILIVDYALKVVQDVLQKELRKKYPNLFDPNTGFLNKVLSDKTVRTILFGLSPKIFNHHQRKQLYPAGNPSTSVTVGDLDLTLTVLLVRNITSLNPRPQLNAWDNPSDTDTSREATIGRIKRYRNTVYGHANKAAISDQEFSTHFLGLKSNLLVLSSRFTNEDYDAILSEPLDADLLRKYRGVLEEWSNYDEDVKYTIGAGFKRISEGITQLLDGQSELKKLCLGKDQHEQNTKVASNPPHNPSSVGVVSQVMETRYLSPPSSREEEITQTASTESTAFSVDLGPSAGTKLKTRRSDTCYQAPIMRPTHKNLLLKMRQMLVENLQVEDIIRDMVATNIFSKDNAEKVMAKETENDQSSEFLRILPKCGPGAFETFVEVLRKHNKKELANLLEEKATACSSKNQIASYYINFMSQIQRLPWDPDDTMHLDDVYVNMQWVQEERKPAGTSSDPIESYTSILDTKQGKTPKRILVRGKAGIGKTTFTQKMATDWANATLGLGECDEVLLNYKHILIINLRSIQPGQTLKEAMETQITCPAGNRKSVTDEVMQAIDYDSDHVLLVFDGYDEYDINTSKDITDIIYRRRYQDVCTVITTRPWKAGELMNRRITDSTYEITGLTEENVAEYVAKFFNDKQTYDEYPELKSKGKYFDDRNKSIGEGLVSYIQEKKLMSLVKTPILLLFICLMWQEDQESDEGAKSLPASYTLLYSKLIQLLLRRRYDIRTQDEFQEPIRKFEQTFINLGKLAYDGLVKKNGGLIFNENDLQTIPNISELYSLGLLGKSKVQSNLDVKHEVTFPHKTIQEFFAAKYLARKLDENDGNILDKLLENFDTLDKLYDMSFVLRFLCGLSRRAITKVLRKAKYFQGELLKENDKDFYADNNSGVIECKMGFFTFRQWCSDLLLEHWYAHCPQETVLPPELISCHTALHIPDSFKHSDPRFQQILYDSMSSPQAYSDLNTLIVECDHSAKVRKLLSIFSKCDMFQKLVAVFWQNDFDSCDGCKYALNHVLSKAPNLQAPKLGTDCSGALLLIPNPGKLLHLDVRDINGQDCQVIQQMGHLEYIRVTKEIDAGSIMPREPLPQLGRIPNTSHGLTHIDISYTPLSAVGVQLLGRNLHHVPGLEHLVLDCVLVWGSRCGPSRCTCPRGEDNTEYDTCQDVREAVRELSQGVKYTSKLTHFSFTGNHLIQNTGISSPLNTLNSVKDGKGWNTCLSKNLESKNEKTSCHHTYQSDYTLLTKVSAQEYTVTTDPEFDHHTLTSSVQNEVAVFFNQDRIEQKEEIQYKSTKDNADEKDDPDIYRQVFLHADLFRYSTNYFPRWTSMLLYPAHLHEYFRQSVQGPPFRNGEEYCYEAVRLSSFKDLPNSVPVRATRLARSGFHYTGNSDEVACFSCGGRLKEWTYGQNPFVRHRNLFPDCPLMKGTETKNVPLFQTDDAISNGNIGANDDPFPNLARSTPCDHVDNASSLLSNQQALSRSLGISSPEVATRHITHSGVAIGVRSKENTSAPLTPPNTSHLPTCVPSRMRNESDRLATFVSWPSGASVRPEDLARAGFFYVGTEDRVQCAFCEGVLRNWELGDQPIQEHRKYLSTCPFVLGLEVGNIPVEEPGTALPLAVSESQSHAVGGSATGSENATTGPTLGILTARPRHERYSTEHARVQTFANWPPSRIPCPETLASAGFFYAGFGDNVKCFFCDGGLRNWEPQDDPWVEHARWFPRCVFLRQCKGDAFIQMIKERNSPNNPPPQAQALARSAQGAPGSYHVEAREIKARLDTPTVQAVLDMGFSRDTVRQAIERRLRDTGDDFPSAANLLDAVLNIEDEMTRQTAQGAAAMAVIPQEEPGQQPLNRSLAEVPASVANQKTSQTQNSEKQSKRDNKKKKKKQDAPVPKESDDKETKSLLEENKRLKEERICKICMDEEVSVVFLPCGHLVACVQCAPALRNCAICRTAIKGTVRSILS